MTEALAVGAQVGAYRLTGELGRGGMGVVYLADDLERGRALALKVLIGELAAQDDFRRRFLREARYARELDHPNIVPVHDVGEANGCLYIAMEYIDGPDLRAVLSSAGRLEPAAAVSMLTDVASALDAVHARGMLHRDVKPGNVLVGGAGDSDARHCYLTDFGLSKNPTRDSVALTAVDTFVGTLDYVAPEQIVADDVDQHVDVYSLTCLLYECLSGRLPFVRSEPTELMRAHIEEVPPALTAVGADLPPAIDEVVARGLAKHPPDRFRSCGELMLAARDALQLPPVEDAAEELKLVVAGGGAGAAEIRVEQDLVIGRSGDGALAGDTEISRRHARIWRDSDRTWAIEDLGSANGTYVNGVAIEGRPRRLAGGDTVQLGGTTLRVEAVKGAQRVAAGPKPSKRLSLRLDVSPAGEVLLALDRGSPALKLVHDEGRWRVERP